MKKRISAALALVFMLLCLTGCGPAPQEAKSPAEIATAAVTPPPVTRATEAAAPDATETPGVYGGTLLFYNPTGGEYYHLDQNCSRVGGKYLPLQGHFTYDRLNDEPYRKLKPCEACSAPGRPQ